MSVSRPAKIAITVTLAGTLVAGTAGAVRAASVTTAPVSACATAKGKLQLLSSKNTCAKGSHRVAIGKQGPRGLTGPRGLRGVQGVRGVQGARGLPGTAPISLTIAGTAPGVVSKQTAPIGGTGLTAALLCEPGLSSALYLEDQTGASDWTVGGSSSYSDNAGGHATYVVLRPSGVSTPAIPPGTTPANFTVAKSKNANFEIVNQGGDLSSNILVGRNGQTFSVMFSSQVEAGHCGAQAQIVG